MDDVLYCFLQLSNSRKINSWLQRCGSVIFWDFSHSRWSGYWVSVCLCQPWTVAYNDSVKGRETTPRGLRFRYKHVKEKQGCSSEEVIEIKEDTMGTQAQE
ncbi:hypothetical protein NQZ68_018627 [Dissostichus eleginoides]|nr:hypothetical protein NQZ68_018627 [Dissostichus eleginoides]